MAAPVKMGLEEGRGLALLDSSNWQQVLVREEPTKRRKSDAGRFTLNKERRYFSEDAIVTTTAQDPLLANEMDKILETRKEKEKEKEKENVSGEEEKKSSLRDQFANKLNPLNKRPPIIQVACYEDKNGLVRDEYGFRVEKDDPIGKTIKEGNGGSPDKPIQATVPKEKKRLLLSKQARMHRQQKAWQDLIQTYGEIQSWSPEVVERWRKYVPPPSILQIISQPGIVQDSAMPELTRMNGNDCHDKGGRVKRPLFFIDAVVRKLRGKLGRVPKRSPKKSSAKSKSREKRQQEEYSSDVANVSETSLDTALETEGSGRIGRKRLLTSNIRLHGVPASSRRDVWLACSGALRKLNNACDSESYERLTSRLRQCSPKIAHEIERDLTRTFPTNYHFEKEDGITAMRRVLLAYSMRNKQIGYCQSMNFLVAMLLLHMEEKYAFWVLAAIVEDLVPGHYTKQMTGMHVDQHVFESLVQQRLPKLHAHLAELELPLASATYQWFLCLFVNALPLETTLHVWDCFLHEGAKALFRIGLAILKLLQKDILAATTFQDAYAVLTSGTRDRRRFRPKKLMRVAYDPLWLGSFPSLKIAQLRELHLPGALQTLRKQSSWEEFDCATGNTAQSPRKGETKDTEELRDGVVISRLLTESTRSAEEVKESGGMGRDRVMSTAFTYQYISEAKELVELITKSSAIVTHNASGRPRAHTSCSTKLNEEPKRRASFDDLVFDKPSVLVSSDSDSDRDSIADVLLQTPEKSTSFESASPSPTQLGFEDEDDDVDDEIEETASTMPVEFPEQFSNYLPSLAYVLSAQQT